MKKIRLKNSKPILRIYQGRTSLDKDTDIDWEYNRSYHSCIARTSAFTSEESVGLEVVGERVRQVLGSVRAEYLVLERKTISISCLDKDYGADVCSQAGPATDRAGIDGKRSRASVCVGRRNESQGVSARPFDDRKSVQSSWCGWYREIESPGSASSAKVWFCKPRVVGWRYNLSRDTDGVSERTGDSERCGTACRASLPSIEGEVNGCRERVDSEDNRTGEESHSSGESAKVRDEGKGRKVRFTSRDNDRNGSVDGVGSRDRECDSRIQQRVGNREDSREVSELTRVLFNVDTSDKILVVGRKCSIWKATASRVSRCTFYQAKQSREEVRVWASMVGQLGRWWICLWADVLAATERYKDAKTVDRNASRNLWRNARVVQLRSRRVVEEECEVVEENGGEARRDSAERTGRLVCWGVGAGSGDEYACKDRSNDWNSQNRVWIQQTKSKVNENRGDVGASVLCVEKSKQVDKRFDERRKWELIGGEFYRMG